MDSLDLLKIFTSPEFYYTALIMILFVLPKLLARYMIPPALTAFGFGSIMGYFSDSILADKTISLLSAIGISSLFLFAGLEIDFTEIRQQRKFLLEHVLIRATIILLAMVAVSYCFDFGTVSAGLFVLALLTPSTGFIFEGLRSSSLKPEVQNWIRLQSISAEIVALALMFVLMRSSSVMTLGASTVVLFVLIAVVPLLFKGFARFIIPHAPESEFAFLMMLAIFASLVTKKLGVYYLVGAFIVGLEAKRFGRIMPSMASESMLSSLRDFASFFTPFYFFYAGVNLSPELFSLQSILLGLALTLAIGGVRVFSICIHRKVSLGESLYESFPVAVSVLPNLVFGLVLANFLEKDPGFPRVILGGLVSYTVLITALPSLFLGFKRKVPNF